MSFRIGIGVALYTFIVQILTERCLTPNNETAECIPLYSCPILIGALVRQQNVPIEFLRRSSCGGSAENPLVCCGTLANFTLQKDSNEDKKVLKRDLLPSTTYCGYQHADDYYRIQNDTSIRISEFPWLATIQFRSLDAVLPSRSYCGGSLISHRYVLSAAHCFINKQFVPEAVKLGEYNVVNTTDCVREPPFEEECSEPVQEIGIEKIIPYPNFNIREKMHDIALIRLQIPVSFSDYIRPICLPFPERPTARIGDILVSTGFGRRNYSGTDVVEIKKKIFSKIITNDDCKKEIQSSSLQLTENQLCVVELTNNRNFECLGDSGGPSAFSFRRQWYQEGILSYGIGCGPGMPRIHTNVKKYVEWILSVIEP